MSEPFRIYDARHYRTLAVEAGYAAWAPSYDAMMDPRIDLALLERVESVAWQRLTNVIELGCGTGRTGAWLRGQGVASLDGVDRSADMLERAASRGIYDRLVRADVTASTLTTGAYDLAISSLVACHLPDLGALYAEAARLTSPNPDGRFVLLDYHPFFLLNGIPTHFPTADGEQIAIENTVHLMSDHVRVAGRAGWVLVEMHERLIDPEWVAAQPNLERHANRPVSFVMVWQRR